jgi:hypothetical protein
MGPQKCVVVLGVKPQVLTKNYCPTFEQVETLVVRPLESCPGEVIKDILEEAAEIAGRPIAIISDAGSELKKGVRLFSKDDKDIHLLDISHRVNTCLKTELNSDECWKEFQKLAGNSVQYLKLSPIAHLCPPRQRTKERMHSAFPLIQWGLRLANYYTTKGHTLSLELRRKIEWIMEYVDFLKTWQSLMEISKKALQLVHERGYYREVGSDFLSLTVDSIVSMRCMDFREEIATILREEGRKVPDGQHYLGSSEVVESLFGSFKAMEGHHASSGLTSLVLALPALTGKTDEYEIQKAMNSITTNDVNIWLEKNLGSTFLAKRRKDLREQEKVNVKNCVVEIDIDVCDLYGTETA